MNFGHLRLANRKLKFDQRKFFEIWRPDSGKWKRLQNLSFQVERWIQNASNRPEEETFVKTFFMMTLSFFLSKALNFDRSHKIRRRETVKTKKETEK